MEASAPGKLIITGEYAVLSGAPAVVMAVDRRARVRLSRGGKAWRLIAPELGVTGTAFRLTAQGCVWEANQTPSAVVDGVMNALAARGILTPKTRPATISTDTHRLWDDQRGEKLGFGSSAAVTAALTRALTGYVGCNRFQWDTFDADLFSLLRRAHEASQGNRGSGADIAASQLGGAIAYSNQPGAMYARPLDLPENLHWLAVWTGRATSTASRLKALDEFSKRDPEAYRLQMTKLQQCAEDAAHAFSNGTGAQVLDQLSRYRTQVASFGNAVGIDILSHPHRELAAVGEASDVVYKSCGAGGGDLGIAFSASANALADFRQRIPGYGYQPLDLSLDPHGVTLAA